MIDILGAAGENNTEMHAILAEYGLPYSYPENVERAADEIPSEITDAALAGREDFRNVTTFTIDPHDATRPFARPDGMEKPDAYRRLRR